MARPLWTIALLAATCLLAAPHACAQSSLRIVGAFSNFDCYNDTPDDTCGFEIEIEGIHKEDVRYTYNYSAFGAPTITDIGTATSPRVLIRYYSSTGIVRPGMYTHFGVTLNSFQAPGLMTRRWLPKVASKPPVPVKLPEHDSAIVSTNGVQAVRDAITNTQPDGGISFWVLPWANIVSREVGLEELMRDDPLVLGSEPKGSGPDGMTPERLDPLDTWFNDDPVGSDDTESTVFWFQVFEDVVTYPNGVETHAPGRMIATIMDATVTRGQTVAPGLNTLTLATSSVYGGVSTVGTVTLTAPAPALGFTVNLSSNNANITVPVKVKVAAGATTARFSVKTIPVTAASAGTITASAAGVSRQANLTVNPAVIKSLSLSVTSVTGGGSVTGTARLTSRAPAGGIVVQLTSSSAMAQVPTTVTIPSGATYATFSITTAPVSITTTAAIKASTSGVSVSKNLKIIP